MNKFWNYWIVFVLVFFTTSAFADSNSNFLGGIAHGQYTGSLTDNTAGTILLEAGPRNNRASGTLGWNINARNRIKVTGEWLWQDLNYNFYMGNVRHWVNQGAAGLAFQYAFNDSFQDFFNLSGYYSHADSVDLSTKVLVTGDLAGNVLIFNNLRRIAGSNAGGISPGITTHPWRGGEILLAANWDDVTYNTKYRSKVQAEGFGGTAGISQRFQAGGNDFKVGATGAWRAPFNNYQAEVSWIKTYPVGQLLIGLFGSYTNGKYTLPNSSLVGVNLSYAMDARPSPIKPPSFTAWMTKPAVYMPQVLAIPDEAVFATFIPAPVLPTCVPPGIAGGGITGQTVDGGVPYSRDVSAFFSGTAPLTFSGSDSEGLMTISPSGVVSGTLPGVTVTDTITVTATNACGSVTQTYVLEIED